MEDLKEMFIEECSKWNYRQQMLYMQGKKSIWGFGNDMVKYLLYSGRRRIWHGR